MKKHDEGYALVLVLVVILVLGIVASSLLSFALSNLKNQRASIDRMADKYEAAGEIEKLVAVLSEPYEKQIESDTLEITVLEGWLAEKGYSCKAMDVKDGIYTVSISDTAVGELSHIKYSIELSGTISKEENAPNWVCKISPTSIVYREYTISYTGGGGE